MEKSLNDLRNKITGIPIDDQLFYISIYMQKCLFFRFNDHGIVNFFAIVSSTSNN